MTDGPPRLASQPMPATPMPGPPPPAGRPRPPRRPGEVRRAPPLRRADAERIHNACPETPSGRRDAALVATMRAGLLRGAEAAGLRWSDVDRQPDGSALLELGATKTDPRARTRRRVRVPPSVTAMIDAMAPDAGDDPRLFRLADGRRVRERISAAGERAGIAGLTGHSPRRGAAQDLIAAGATVLELQHAGRWSTIDAAQRYVAEMAHEAAPAAAYAILDPDHRPEPRESRSAEPASRTMRIVLEGLAGALRPRRH